MYPEDRVLVAVVNRRRDLDYLQGARWYRVPQAQFPDGLDVEYLAFFLSRAFKERNGGIHYYARCQGIELARRRDLLPDEAAHPRADAVYYKVQISSLLAKVPPILNPARRPVSFIFTTWDRFTSARQIGDLFSQAGYFVDRVYYALDGRRPRRAPHTPSVLEGK